MKTEQAMGTGATEREARSTHGQAGTAMPATLRGSWRGQMPGSIGLLLGAGSVIVAALLAAIILADRTPIVGVAQAQGEVAGVAAPANALPVLKPNYWSVPLHVRGSLPGATSSNE